MGKGNNRRLVEFNQIYQEHYVHVHDQCIHICKDPDVAFSAIQNTFVTVWRKLDTFRGRSKLSSWIYQIALNCSLIELRKRRQPNWTVANPNPEKNSPFEHEQIGEYFAEPACNNPLRKILALEALQFAKAANRDRRYIKVIELADWLDFNVKEIQSLIGGTIPEIKSKMRRGRVAWRVKFKQKYEKAA